MVCFSYQPEATEDIMTDTKLSVTSVEVTREYGVIVADEVTDDGSGTTNLHVFVTRETAAKAILAEANGDVFVLMNSRGMIYEVWAE